MLKFFSLADLFYSLSLKYPLVRRFFLNPLPLIYLPSHASTKEAILVLPPSDYWAKKVTLNVNTAQQALAYAPAVFDLGSQYHYQAKKIEDHTFVLVAYNPAEVSEKILALSNPSEIRYVTFSQWVFADQTQPIALGKGHYLTHLDEIVIELDGAYIDTNLSISLNDALKVPQYFLKTVAIQTLIPTILTSKTLQTTFILLLVLLGNLMAKSYFNYQEITQLKEQTQTILDTSNLPQTSIEREAILGSLKEKERKQLSFRRQCKRIDEIAYEVKKAPVVAPAVTAVKTLQLPPALPLLPPPPLQVPGINSNQIVQNTTSFPSQISVHGEGMQSFVYDGYAINFTIDVRDLLAGEKLKNELQKRLTNPQISVNSSQVEVRLR